MNKQQKNIVYLICFVLILTGSIIYNYSVFRKLGNLYYATNEKLDVIKPKKMDETKEYYEISYAAQDKFEVLPRGFTYKVVPYDKSDVGQFADAIVTKVVEKKYNILALFNVDIVRGRKVYLYTVSLDDFFYVGNGVYELKNKGAKPISCEVMNVDDCLKYYKILRYNNMKNLSDKKLAKMPKYYVDNAMKSIDMRFETNKKIEKNRKLQKYLDKHKIYSTNQIQ